MMRLIAFKLHGRFGHFLRAEAGASALSYPVPPRTVVMGIIGAVLGIEKDKPQLLLEPMHVAINARIPITHWHKAKLRKDPPEALSHRVKSTQKPKKTTKPEKATLTAQEWLFNPSYEVWVSLPEPYFEELEKRLKRRRWYFQPSLGLSEMLADLEYLETVDAEKLPAGTYDVESIVRHDQAELDISRINKCGLSLQILKIRMPRIVTTERVFTHEAYLIEKNGEPIIVNTEHAYQVAGRNLMFL